MNNETCSGRENRMQFLLLGISERFGVTDQIFFDDLPAAEREAHAMQDQRVQPYLFRLEPVPVAHAEIDDKHFLPLCYSCGAPVDSRRGGFVCYDDGRVYHAGCDEHLA